MSQQKTLFSIFPNEILFCIFEFLKSYEIIQSFFDLNQRYEDIVRYYIKQVDLTDNWQDNKQALQKICQTIEKVKVNQNNINLLLDYKYPQLNSVISVNVIDWERLLQKKNLQKLKTLFEIEERMPTASLPITRFSSNDPFNVDFYHENLIDLTVFLCGICQLIELVIKTPNLKYLHVTFYQTCNNYSIESFYRWNSCQTMRLECHRLKNLNCLSLTTSPYSLMVTYADLSFERIQIFIDEFCPNETILKKIIFKFHGIYLSEDLWSTIQIYKNTFEQFHFYISFIVNSNFDQIQNLTLSNTQSAFHIEYIQSDSLSIQKQIIHVYSLPFVFKSLYGFNRYFELDQRCSYKNVRHLDTVADRDGFGMSFESLGKQMPNLVSINFCLNICHQCSNDHLSIIKNDDILSKLRTFQFKLDCMNSQCIYYTQYYQLIRSMTNLKTLITTYSLFSRIDYPLISITKLHLYQCRTASFDNLSQIVRNLNILILTSLRVNRKCVFPIVKSLLKQYLNSIVISLRISEQRSDDVKPYRKLAEQVVRQLQSTDERFQQVKLTFGDRRMQFSLPKKF